MSEIPPPTVPPATPPPPGGGSYVPPPPPRPGGTAPAGSDRTLMIALSYLWILALIPLLTKKEDAEVQWHAKNGLVLFGAEIIVYIILQVLSYVMPSGIGCGMSVIWCVAWVAFLVLRIMAIMKGVNGQRFRIPVVSDFADKM